MSFEQILILVFFIVLPLIQLLRDAVEKNQRAQQSRRQGPPEVPRHPPVPEPMHLPADVYIPPEVLQERVKPKTEPATAPVVRAPAVRAPAAPLPRRTRPAIAGLHSPAQLRQAILLFTILGPCRAIVPHGTPDSAGRD